MCDVPQPLLLGRLLQGAAHGVLDARRRRGRTGNAVDVGALGSGDLIGENMEIQPCEVGDIIAVCATGAYNYSMASNYNRLQKPAVVFVKGGEDRLAVKRESLDDILRNDI